MAKKTYGKGKGGKKTPMGGKKTSGRPCMMNGMRY